jgi:hypothetical protein
VFFSFSVNFKRMYCDFFSIESIKIKNRFSKKILLSINDIFCSPIDSSGHKREYYIYQIS